MSGSRWPAWVGPRDWHRTPAPPGAREDGNVMSGQPRSQDEPKTSDPSVTSIGEGAAPSRGRRAMLLGAAAAGAGYACALEGTGQSRSVHTILAEPSQIVLRYFSPRMCNQRGR
jgi:hypothetical protein